MICLLKAYIILIRNKNNIDTESNSDESAIKREKKTNDDSPKKSICTRGFVREDSVGAAAPTEFEEDRCCTN